jgi:hypothetical protein
VCAESRELVGSGQRRGRGFVARRVPRGADYKVRCLFCGGDTFLSAASVFNIHSIVSAQRALLLCVLCVHAVAGRN